MTARRLFAWMIYKGMFMTAVNTTGSTEDSLTSNQVVIAFDVGLVVSLLPHSCCENSDDWRLFPSQYIYSCFFIQVKSRCPRAHQSQWTNEEFHW